MNDLKNSPIALKYLELRNVKDKLRPLKRHLRNAQENFRNAGINGSVAQSLNSANKVDAIIALMQPLEEQVVVLEAEIKAMEARVDRERQVS